jgi:hypothetical protein
LGVWGCHEFENGRAVDPVRTMASPSKSHLADVIVEYLDPQGRLVSLPSSRYLLHRASEMMAGLLDSDVVHCRDGDGLVRVRLPTQRFSAEAVEDALGVMHLRAMPEDADRALASLGPLDWLGCLAERGPARAAAAVTVNRVQRERPTWTRDNAAAFFGGLPRDLARDLVMSREHHRIMAGKSVLEHLRVAAAIGVDRAAQADRGLVNVLFEVVLYSDVDFCKNLSASLAAEPGLFRVALFFWPPAVVAHVLARADKLTPEIFAEVLDRGSVGLPGWALLLKSAPDLVRSAAPGVADLAQPGGDACMLCETPAGVECLVLSERGAGDSRDRGRSEARLGPYGVIAGPKDAAFAVRKAQAPTRVVVVRSGGGVEWKHLTQRAGLTHRVLRRNFLYACFVAPLWPS